jgi:hypothetical protein
MRMEFPKDTFPIKTTNNTIRLLICSPFMFIKLPTLYQKQLFFPQIVKNGNSVKNIGVGVTFGPLLSTYSKLENAF